MAKVKAFRCARTGLYYPPDYVENWGLKYGRGLGPQAVSEACVNEYNRPIAKSSDPTRTMHAIGHCRAQVDFVEIEEAEYYGNLPILMRDDPRMDRLGQLMRDKQLQKSVELQGIFQAAEVEAAAARIAAYQSANMAKMPVQPVEPIEELTGSGSVTKSATKRA